MQKKIIVLAVASALTVPALAFAEATVYGQMNASIDMINDGAVTNSASMNQLNSNTSRLGWKGSEDVGGGLSVVWQLEMGLGLDNGTTGGTGTTNTANKNCATTAAGASSCSTTAARVFNRNTFVGMSSATMGTLIVGQNDSPYKTSTRRLDLFGDGIADNRGNQSTGGAQFASAMMGGGHDARLSNAIAYVSPSMSGFTVALASVFGAETAGAITGSGITAPKKGSAYSLAAMYDQGPFYAALALDNVKLGDVGTGDLGANPYAWQASNVTNVDDKSDAMKLGGGYTTEQFAVNAVYETVKNTVATSGAETKWTNMYLAGKFNISSTDAVKLAYTNRGTQKTAGVDAKNAAKQMSLGYDHSMSKATTVYALYSKLTQDATNAADPSVISLGLKHSF